jgi:hypothetical protein
MRKVYQSVVKFLKKVPWPFLAGVILVAALILGALYYRAEAARQRVYTVRPGDPLSFTSVTYGVDIDDLRTANDMLEPGTIATLAIPVEKTVEVEKVVEKTVEVVQTIDKEASFQEVTGTRMVVYTVDMSIVVKDTQAALDQIERLTNEAGGYVVSAKTTQYEGGAYGNAVIRVPTEELDNVLAQLESLALEVRNLNKTGSDVTEEYVDLESRVKVLEAAEQELLELYQTRQADGEVTDILEVYQQLVAFREEIETLTGRMQYLEESSAMAKVTISITPDALAQPVQIGRWRPDGTAREALEVLVSSFQFLVDMLIWGVILVLPLALLVGGAIFGIGWLIRRRRRAQPKEEAPTDASDKALDGE